MQKHIFSLLSFFFCISTLHGDIDTAVGATTQVQQEETSNLILLDQVDVVIVGHDHTEIITKSDLDRQSLGGGYRTQDDIIFEKIVLIDAKKHQIPDDPEAVEAGFAQMQREHNLTQEDFENIFKAAGYTYEEGRQQFQIMQMVNTMLDIKVRSNLIVPRKDVESYYHEHPEFVEATYTLERLFVPFSTKISKQTQKRKIMHYIKIGKGVLDAQPGVQFTISHSEVASKKQFIYTMELGDISMPEEISGGFEMFRLISKTPEYRKTLEESYRDIVDILRRPKYEELLEKYREQLLKNVSIIYM
jgi:hypothetical protein